MRAETDLAEARTLSAIPLAKLAARSAYYAAFHAAEAMIAVHTGRVAKTHRGVHVAFSRIIHDLTGADPAMPRVLIDGYRFKELADDGTDPTRTVTVGEARAIIDDATRFVARVAELLARPSSEA